MHMKIFSSEMVTYHIKHLKQEIQEKLYDGYYHDTRKGVFYLELQDFVYYSYYLNSTE